MVDSEGEDESNEIHGTESQALGSVSITTSLLDDDQDDANASHRRLTRRLLRHEKSALSEEGLHSPPSRGEPSSSRAANTWKTSYYRRGPILGLCSLLFVFLSIPATAIVLKVSDGQPVQAWNKFRPNVYLAVITGGGNKLLAFAASEGAIITWWLRALKETTLRSLHRDWAMGPGSNIWAILTAGITAGTLAISMLCATFIFVDGVLLQAATTVQQTTLTETVTLEANLFPEIPANYTGLIHKHTATEFWLQGFHDSLQPVYQDLIHSRPITSPVKGCPGKCTTILRSAAAWRENCTKSFTLTGDMDLLKWFAYKKSYPESCANSNIGPERCPLFTVYIGIATTGSSPGERIAAWIGRSDQSIAMEQNGTFATHLCPFRPATADFPVTIEKDVVRVHYSEAKQVAWVNNTKNASSSGDLYINTTFGGIAVLADLIWSTTFAVGFGDDSSPKFNNMPVTAAKYLLNPEEYFNFDNSSDYPIWGDPLDDIHRTLNEIMFRTSVQAAKEFNENDLANSIDRHQRIASTVDGQSFTTVPTFHTRWEYYIVASLVQLVCIMLVGWTFWGYWRLGRSMSMSPLEIAKALLRSVDSNMTGKGIAKHVGDQNVRYGAVGGGIDDSTARRLIFERPIKCTDREHLLFQPISL